MEKITIIDAFDKFVKIEEKYNLLDFKIDNVLIWQFCRYVLFTTIIEKAKIAEQPHSKIDSRFQRFLLLPKYILSSIIKNPFLSREKNGILIFEHPRKIKKGRKYIDQYTYYLREELKKHKKKCILLSERYLGKQYNWGKNHYHLDFFLMIYKIFFFFYNKNFTSEQLNFFVKVQKEIKDEFKIQISLKNFFIKYLIMFKVYYKLYNYLLKKLKPQKIYIVVSYGLQGALIKVAKELGINVCELQHGIISKYHIGYSYPFLTKKELEYFPNCLMVWSEMWKTMPFLPIPEDKIIVSDLNPISKEANKFSDVKKENLVVIISQGTIGSQLSEFIYRRLICLRNYKVIYKLHPGEYDRFHKYKYMDKLLLQANFEIIANSNLELYQILAKAKYVIGVYSTVLIEAQHFGCKILIIKLQGYKNVYEIIGKNENVSLIGSECFLSENDRD